MNILPIVLIFSLLIVMFSSTVVTRSVDLKILHILSDQYTKTIVSDFDRRMKNCASQAYTQKNPTSKGRTRCHPKLNIIYLRQGPSGAVQDPDKAPVVQPLLANLITILYRDQKFFKEAQKKYPRPSEELVKRLFLYGRDLEDNHPFIKTVEDLANVDLRDPLLQEMLYQILKGDDTKDKDPKTYSAPSLYKYIEIRKTAKFSPFFSLWGAKMPLLIATFEKVDVAKQVRAKIQELYVSMRDEKKQNKSTSIEAIKNKCSNDLKNYCEKFLPSRITRDWLDYNVSFTNPSAKDEEEFLLWLQDAAED